MGRILLTLFLLLGLGSEVKPQDIIVIQSPRVYYETTPIVTSTVTTTTIVDPVSVVVPDQYLLERRGVFGRRRYELYNTNVVPVRSYGFPSIIVR